MIMPLERKKVMVNDLLWKNGVIFRNLEVNEKYIMFISLKESSFRIEEIASIYEMDLIAEIEQDENVAMYYFDSNSKYFSIIYNVEKSRYEVPNMFINESKSGFCTNDDGVLSFCHQFIEYQLQENNVFSFKYKKKRGEITEIMINGETVRYCPFCGVDILQSIQI